MKNLTTLTEIDHIAAMTDPVIRNHQITQSYYELSLALSKRTGRCANWCTFAMWASNQAGQTIRGEDLTSALEHALKTTPAVSQAIHGVVELALLRGASMNKEGLVKLVWETIDPIGAMERASAAVARGNRKVFAEIAREFARFLAVCGQDQAFDPGKLTDFCTPLKPGDPPDGQRYLSQAFSRYYQAFFEADPKTKAELILLANIEIGFHEQTRLQPEIAEALETFIPDPFRFKETLIAALFPRQTWVGMAGNLFRRLTGQPSPSDKAVSHLVAIARRRVRLFLTDRLMELRFPKGQRLKLGKDLKAAFPPSLKTLAYPDLVALLYQIDPTPDSVLETGAIDWANLYDRLHFIADLFRCSQENLDLFDSVSDN